MEAAANTVHELCLQAAQEVIDRSWFGDLAIPPTAIDPLVRSWNEDDFSLYGRFDFAYDGTMPPKLLEYNADTPTALVEAAVAQWFWLEDNFRNADQFNSVHERLIEAWKLIEAPRIHFCSIKDFPEDEQTVSYLLDTAQQAGKETKFIYLEDIGWNENTSRFVDQENHNIDTCFKLYPWEWMWHEEFGKHLRERDTQFIEPCWKMLFSNKAMLPILWKLFPDHPNLLPCFDEPSPLGNSYIRKPKLSREGHNIQLIENGVIVEETPGEYGEEGFVFQAVAKTNDFLGSHPIMGVWMIHNEAGGLGIREDSKRVTGNLSRFVPHYFLP